MRRGSNRSMSAASSLINRGPTRYAGRVPSAIRRRMDLVLSPSRSAAVAMVTQSGR
jgi:hypothetical protein